MMSGAAPWSPHRIPSKCSGYPWQSLPLPIPSSAKKYKTLVLRLNPKNICLNSGLILMDYLRQKKGWYLSFFYFFCLLSGTGIPAFLIQYRDGGSLRLPGPGTEQPLGFPGEYTPGRILDRNRVPLTGERTEMRVVLFPAAVGNSDEVSRGTGRILGVEEDRLNSF